VVTFNNNFAAVFAMSLVIAFVNSLVVTFIKTLAAVFAMSLVIEFVNSQVLTSIVLVVLHMIVKYFKGSFIIVVRINLGHPLYFTYEVSLFMVNCINQFYKLHLRTC